MSVPTSNKCSKCGRTLTNPASIQMGIGPICAAKSGIVSAFSHPKYRSMFDFNCQCPYCKGLIERVLLNEWGTLWTWTCGGVSGDGCHTDFGSNTVAPLKVDLAFMERNNPEALRKYVREREFHREVANRTFERLRVRAVPPYPMPLRVMQDPMPPIERELLNQRILETVKEVWKEFHARGRYGRYCQFYDPEMEHCAKCGKPVKRMTMYNTQDGEYCQDCFKEEYPQIGV